MAMPRKKQALLLIGCGLLAMVLIGPLMISSNITALMVVGVMLLFAGFFALLIGVYRLCTAAKAEPTAEQRRTDKLNAGLAGAGLLCIVAAMFVIASGSKMTPDKAGELGGHIAFFAIMVTLVLGGILKLAKLRLAWGIAWFAAGLMVLLFMLFGMFVGSADKQHSQAALTELKNLLAEVNGGQRVVPRQYSEADYGPEGPLLTLVSADVANFQQQETGLRAKEAEIGVPNLGSPRNLTDPVARTAAHRQLASLRIVYGDEHDVLVGYYGKIRADVESSSLSAPEKAGFLNGFDGSYQKNMPQIEGYYSTATQLLDHMDRMFTIADKDEPRLINGKAIFNKQDDLSAEQAEARTVADLGNKMQQLRQVLQQGMSVSGGTR